MATVVRPHEPSRAYVAVGMRVWVLTPAADGASSLASGAGAPGLQEGIVVTPPKEVAGTWTVMVCSSGPDDAGPAGPPPPVVVQWWQMLPRRSDGRRVDTAALVGAFREQRLLAEQRSGAGRVAAPFAPAVDAGRVESRRKEFEGKAARYWDIFYKHNSINFFKDRHWLDREFPEIRQTVSRVRELGDPARKRAVLVRHKPLPLRCDSTDFLLTFFSETVPSLVSHRSSAAAGSGTQSSRCWRSTQTSSGTHATSQLVPSSSSKRRRSSSSRLTRRVTPLEAAARPSFMTLPKGRSVGP